MERLFTDCEAKAESLTKQHRDMTRRSNSMRGDQQEQRHHTADEEIALLRKIQVLRIDARVLEKSLHKLRQYLVGKLPATATRAFSKNSNAVLVCHFCRAFSANVCHQMDDAVGVGFTQLDAFPLLISARTGDLEMTKLLVRECGADVTQVDQNGRNACMIAVLFKRQDVVEYLLSLRKRGYDDRGVIAEREHENEGNMSDAVDPFPRADSRASGAGDAGGATAGFGVGEDRGRSHSRGGRSCSSGETDVPYVLDIGSKTHFGYTLLHYACLNADAPLVLGIALSDNFGAQFARD